MILRTGKAPVGADAKVASAKGRAGFTLIELILVMFVLATVLAMVAPSLSGFMKQRHLEAEACRVLALTQFARSEAMSRGIPLVVWIDPKTQTFGLEAMDGYPSLPGRRLEYTLERDLRFVVERTASQAGSQVRIIFWPDGTIDDSEAPVVILEQPSGERLYIVRAENQLAYKVLDEEAYADRLQTELDYRSL